MLQGSGCPVPWVPHPLSKNAQLKRMTVTDNDLKRVEQRRHETSIKQQSFVFDRNKRPTPIPSEAMIPWKQGKKVRFIAPQEGETSQPEKLKTRQDLAEEGLSHNQSKYKNVSFRGRMCPDESIRHHPAFDALYRYATEGCPVDCGLSWTAEHLEAAVLRGPHISAKSAEAARCLREEAMEKVAQGEAEIIKWDDIKANPHPKLKISPLAAVPHKSRMFRAILDLSFQLRINGILFPSVNEATTPISNHRSMSRWEKFFGGLLRKWQNVTQTTGTFSLRSGISKTAFGGSSCRKKMHGISATSCQNSTTMTPLKLFAPPAYRWDGVNRHLCSVQRPKLRETWHRNLPIKINHFHNTRWSTSACRMCREYHRQQKKKYEI